MNPSRASDKSDLRHLLGSDEAVANYVSEMKRRGFHPSSAQRIREVVDQSMQGSLTELLYKSREDGQT